MIYLYIKIKRVSTFVTHSISSSRFGASGWNLVESAIVKAFDVVSRTKKLSNIVDPVNSFRPAVLANLETVKKKKKTRKSLQKPQMFMTGSADNSQNC